MPDEKPIDSLTLDELRTEVARLRRAETELTEIVSEYSDQIDKLTNRMDPRYWRFRRDLAMYDGRRWTVMHVDYKDGMVTLGIGEESRAIHCSRLEQAYCKPEEMTPGEWLRLGWGDKRDA